jgi:sphingolipid 8-(E)-desaturase
MLIHVFSRLHSAEARHQMQRYQIGRIEGRWKNFSPPIQGGKFRKFIDGQSQEDDNEDMDGGSASDISRTPSPVFDTDDITLRQRKPQVVDRSSSVSSRSSSTDDGDREGLSFIDARTKEELDLDLSKYPPLDHATQDEIVRKYRLLNERIRAQGLYNCHYSAYGYEVVRYSFLFAMMLLCLRWGWHGLGGLFLGLFWHQLVFTAHDAGHMGITHNFVADTVIGIIIADFIGGLSLGWWKRTHNVHHIVTNHPEHDPDNQHMPFFALSPRFLQSLYSTYHERIMAFDAVAEVFVPYQAYMYYPILTMGRFNLYVQSWIFLILGLGPKKGPAWWTWWLEIAGQVFFWLWFGYGILYKTIPTGWGRFAFVMVSHMVTMPLHVQITLSHFAMSTSDLGPHESFPQKMLRTTMDVDCPQWLDFIHGGLQFQAIHHLYPRIPRHNLRATQKLVQAFCIEVGIPYALYGFVDGNKEVIGRLDEVGRQAAIFARCQQTLAEKGDVLHGH